jgi:hypothetical protein
LQQSDSLITLGITTSYSPMLRRIGALSRLMTQFKVPAQYPKEISDSNQLSFTYTLQGAETSHLASPGRHWLYLFPFDSADVYIPIELRQSALLSHLELQKPSGDYFADVSISGLPISLAESENGDRYEFANSDPMVRTPMWGNTVTLHAKFERTSFQRWGLTLGVAVLALLVGAFGGWFTTLPDKSWIGFVITTLGLSGLVFAVRAAVLSTYKDLPTLMTGQGTTIFELLYLVSIALMVGAIFVTRKLLKP